MFNALLAVMVYSGIWMIASALAHEGGNAVGHALAFLAALAGIVSYPHTPDNHSKD